MGHRCRAAEPIHAARAGNTEPKQAATMEPNNDHGGIVPPADPGAPSAFVIDDERGIRLFVGKVLEKLGFAVSTFSKADDALAALNRHAPDIIFLDIALEQSDAVDVIKGLGDQRYGGVIQLMSGNPRLLAAIQRLANRDRLNIRPPLSKPFKGEAIRQVVAEAQVGGMMASAR
jgi:two-component system, NtrC family, C4-dicarboxylate transport response regulator DctD